MLYKLFRNVITPTVFAAQSVQRFIYSRIPSFIIDVTAVNTQSLEAYPIYTAPYNGFSWHRAHATTRDLDVNWFYHIKVWNNDTRKIEEYFLNTQHLCKALGITGIDRMWALSDLGIVSSLAAYVRQQRGQDIFDIGVNGQYMSQKMAPIMSSLRLDDNVTKEALLVYLFYHDLIDTIDIYNAKLVKMNYDLDEIPVDNGTTL